MCAAGAESRLTHTEKQTKSTAPVRAMQMPEEKAEIKMDNALFRRLLLYRATMTAVKIMLDSGLISVEEYAVTDTIIAEKYGLNSSVIYR